MYKRSETLVFSPSDDAIVFFNYLTKSTFECSTDVLEFLNLLSDWRSLEEIQNELPSFSHTELQSQISQLVDCGAIVAQGSELEANEFEYDEQWSWGIPAAMLHFGVQDNKCISVERSEEIQLKKKVDAPQPNLHLSNREFDRVHRLPSCANRTSLLSLMAKRRTNRDVQDKSITLENLSELLFSGMGIIGETENLAGKLPLSMTPSGGARNPFEAYVIARNVEGLDAGLYHYSAMEHSLGNISPPTAERFSPSTLIGDQKWMDQMSAVVFLVAHLERSMWKYEDANAYRVMLIEAGHIAQNMMLTATESHLTACPSAALAHDKIKSTFGIQGLTRAPIYALGIGHPICN